MSVAFRAASTGSITSGSASVSITKPTGTIDTDFLVAFQSTGSTGIQSQLTGPSGWANLGFGGTDGFTGVIQVWTKVASGEPASWTWGHTAGFGNMCVAVNCFSAPAATPMDGSTIFDKSTATGTTATSSGVTTAFTNDILLLAVMANSGAPTLSTPTGMTNQTTVVAGATNALSTFTQTIPATGATGTRASTISASQHWVTAAIAISNFLAASNVKQKIVQSRAALINGSTW